MKHLEALEIFQRVAELSSFTAAAESLGLPKSSVSMAVQQLENFVGTRLLHRTTRRVQLTPDGETLYSRSRDLLDEVDAIQHLFRDDHTEVRGRLRVDVPLGVARDTVVPNLPAFLEEHPGLDVELSSTDRRVDLVREGFDCVLRVGSLKDSSLVARRLGHFRIINVVGRTYAERHGIPQNLDDLPNHRMIHYVPNLGGRSPGFEYVLPDAPERVYNLPMPGALTVSNSEAYKGACLAGLGLIQVPEPPMREYLASGDMIDVLPDYRCAPMPLSLLYGHRRHLPRRVKVFMDWLGELMAPQLI